MYKPGKIGDYFLCQNPNPVKLRVKAFLKIEGEGGKGKYLGLPENFNRRKRDIFAELVDRIRQRSHSWSTKFLNGAGKHVLLKAVLAALPLYSMSCFMLPISLCRQIKSLLTQFWWDAKPDLKKMAWVAWNKLTLPKSLGGLGFRNLELFNDALLGKLAWQNFKNPSSVLAQNLLGKYAHKTSFLDAKAPKSPSHRWRSMLVGREVLRKGLGWIVGSGSSIRVWEEPWLSTEQPLSPMGPPIVDSVDLLVSDLMLPQTMEWNVPFIREMLPQYEETIRKIITSSFHMQDEMIWVLDKTGIYSTKTAYAAQKILADVPEQPFDWKKIDLAGKSIPKTKALFVENQEQSCRVPDPR